MALRKFERYPTLAKARWNYFAENTGKFTGYLTDISQGGCLLKTAENIDTRRWLRILIENEKVCHTVVGRVVRKEHGIDLFNDTDFTLFSYGLEFTHPTALTSNHLDLILDLSRRNLTVLSWRNRNEMSSA